jgi:molybdopterin biosynthesis enzyme
LLAGSSDSGVEQRAVARRVLGESAERLREAEAAAGSEPLMRVEPFKLKTAAIIATGSEVASGRIEDAFTPAVEAKLAGFGISCTYRAKPGDGRDDIVAAIAQARSQGVDLVLCTGGMSVDPDDNTPGAIKASGARIVTYGAPVLPGAMLLVGYYDDGTHVLGLPGCVMYAKATIFDLLLPRIAAGIQIEKRDVVAMGEGGLCLGCKPCTYPHCPFGK